MILKEIHPVMLTCDAREALRLRTLESYRQAAHDLPSLQVINDKWAIENKGRKIDNLVERIRTGMKYCFDLALLEQWPWTLYLEDDIEFGKWFEHNLAQWTVPLDRPDCALASLWRCSIVPSHTQGPDWETVQAEHWCGAQALLIPLPTIAHLVSTWDLPEYQIHAADCRAIRLAAKIGRIYCHVPSLVEHRGDKSTWAPNRRPDEVFHSANYDPEWKAS